MSEFSDELARLREEWEIINRIDNILLMPPISHKTMPSTKTPGWDRAFEEMEDDDAAEQAFAVTLGFKDASEYHAETDWCDRMGLSVDWYEREDLRP